tara:strand:- start:16979 stop:17251 length:273 start_codon:yes stop_codon:yes gene_type:complete
MDRARHIRFVASSVLEFRDCVCDGRNRSRGLSATFFLPVYRQRRNKCGSCFNISGFGGVVDRGRNSLGSLLAAEALIGRAPFFLGLLQKL